MAVVDLPDSLIFSNLVVKHNIPNYKTESISMKQKTKARGLHRMEGTIDVTLGDLQSQKAWTSFLLRVQGSLNEFELGLPLHFTSDIVSNPTITSPVGIGTTQLNLGAFGGTILQGSCFTVLNDPKIYHTTSDITGGGNVNIYPALQKSQLANTVLNFKTPKITVRFSEDVQSITYGEGGLILDATIDWVEALS